MAETVKIFEWTDVVNPAANTILASTGPINEGAPIGTNISLMVFASCSVAATFSIRVRNAVGTVVKQFKIIVPANNTQRWGDASATFQAPNDFSIDVINPSAITGTTHGQIFLGVITGY